MSKILLGGMEFEHIVIDAGQTVLCDLCNADYSESEEKGGFLFQSKGVCPKCAPRFLKSIQSYNEEKYIKGHCPKNTSFKDWILSMR